MRQILKAEKMSNMDHTKKPAVLDFITPVVLLVVKSGKSLVSDRGEEIYVKGGNPLPFEKLVFLNGQSISDDHGILFVEMTST